MHSAHEGALGHNMRVLLGTAYYESHNGGIEIVAGHLARELRLRGCHVTWAASDVTPPPALNATFGEALPLATWNITERRLGLPLPLPSLRSIARIIRAVRDSDALLLHDALYPTNIVAMLASRWLGKPVVLVQHIGAIEYRNPITRRLMSAATALITRPILAAANQVVFISEAVKLAFDDVRYKAPPQLVFNGVDPDTFKPPAHNFDRACVRAKLGLPADRKTVLFVGRFVEKKGLYIIERLARLRPQTIFALAGWGPINPRSWGLPNVCVLSDLNGPTLAPLYQASDFFLLPSVGEGFPLVIQEALGCGLPVICAAETARADPAIAEMVVGVPINADSAQTATDVSQTIDRLMMTGEEVRGGAAAQMRHDFVRRRYNWSAAARTYEQMLRGLIARVSDRDATVAVTSR